MSNVPKLKIISQNVYFIAGLLTSGDSRMPGNFAIYDQVEVLKWIRRHISAFGGNPNKVTIFGNSAGGASVGVLLLCPAAAGEIFHIY